MYAILYVDDEPDLLELVKLFLETSQEFSVDTKESAIEGLQAIKDRHYDAIISDFQMPGMDGIAFLKEIRSNFGDIPFIIFTGRGREEVVIEALNYGADFYLKKGGNSEALYTEIMHVIRRTIQMRQAEVTRAAQEQRYHDLQNATDLIQSIAPDGHFLFVNRKWQDMLGYNEADLAKLTLFDIIDEESMEHCRELFPRVIAGENVGIIDVVFKTRDGKKVYAEGLSTCKIIDGKPEYTRGIFRDVTDRRQIEAALAENRDYLSQIYSSVQEGIMIIDAGTHEIIDLNPAAAKMIGRTKDQILHNVCHTFICPAEQGNCPITDLHQVMDNAERVLLTADGKRVDIIKYVVPFDLHGRACLLETFIDNTERKRLGDAILRTNKQLSLLSGVTRHDIINKISVIQGNIAIARKRGPEQDYTALLDKLESTADGILSQVEFTRLYQALGTKKPEWQKPGTFVAAEHLPDSVTVRNEPGELEIYADLMLEKVFHNLADNSIRHGGNVTEIRLHTHVDPEGLTIMFEDNGIGIPAEEKEKIFKRGYGKHTGLGLFLVREILSITGITIRETGKAGKGARFEIHVPDNAYRLSHA